MSDPRPDSGGYLAPESDLMEVHRRIEVQSKLGKATGARVISKQDPEKTQLLEQYKEEVNPEFVNEYEEHDLLKDLQYLDGCNRKFNIDPRINPDAKIEYENAQNEKQYQHNLKLGLTPGKKWEPPTPY